MRHITTPFSARSTASDVLAGIDLSGRTALITGAASGVGRETARALAAAGAAVTLAVRDRHAGERAAQDVRDSTGSAQVHVVALDLTDLGSIDALTAQWQGPLDMLINNAGVMMPPLSYTRYGWELQFATNHLGHFALAVGLHRALAEAAGRVVSVSSSAHGSAAVDFDDPFFRHRPYDPGVAYGQSKTANVLFAVAAGTRWRNDGITANAVMPGGIWSNLQRHWDPARLAAMRASVPTVDQVGAGGVKTAQQGAATSVLAAAHPLLDGVSGRYLEDCQEAQLVRSITDGLHGVVAHALDAAAAERLWDLSLRLLAAAHPQGLS